MKDFVSLIQLHLSCGTGLCITFPASEPRHGIKLLRVCGCFFLRQSRRRCCPNHNDQLCVTQFWMTAFPSDGV